MNTCRKRLGDGSRPRAKSGSLEDDLVAHRATGGLASSVPLNKGRLHSEKEAHLLDNGNLYAAAALLRQLVEVEYLAWAFAEDDEEAAAWLRSTKEERTKFWQPRLTSLGKRSAGRFKGGFLQHHPVPLFHRLRQSNRVRIAVPHLRVCGIVRLSTAPAEDHFPGR
jgi:hypothetical protein